MNDIAEKLNNEGVQFFMQGNFSEAKQKYKAALKKEPLYATTLNNLGMLCLQENDYKQAEKYFRQALKEKTSATYLLNLGHALANQNKLDEAETAYSESIQLNYASLMAWKSLASLYQFKKEFVKSSQTWKYIIENFDNDNEYKIQLAKDLIALESFDHALAVLHEASLRTKHQEIIWYYIAQIQLHKTNYGLALKAINQAVAIEPINNKFRILLANIYLAKSDLSNALNAWDTLLELNPQNRKIRMDKAVALLAHHQIDASLIEIETVLKEDKSDSKALFYKAIALMEKNENSKEAQNLLSKLKASGTMYGKKAFEILEKMKSKK